MLTNGVCHTPVSYTHLIPKKDYSARRLIDTSDEKFQNSPGLQQWAAIENLKIAAQSYNEAGSLSDLEHKITVKNEAGRLFPQIRKPNHPIWWSKTCA